MRDGGSDAGYVHELTDEGGDSHGESAADDDPSAGSSQVRAGNPRSEDSGASKPDQGDGHDGHSRAVAVAASSPSSGKVRR